MFLRRQWQEYKELERMKKEWAKEKDEKKRNAQYDEIAKTQVRTILHYLKGVTMEKNEQARAILRHTITVLADDGPQPHIVRGHAVDLINEALTLMEPPDVSDDVADTKSSPVKK